MRAFLIASVGLVLIGNPASAEDLTRYRAYVLDSSLASVVETIGVRAGEAKTLHLRPAKIQELEWRAPYAGFDAEPADPVRGIMFSFYNDALYQVVVTYDRDRTAGLTASDLIDSLAVTYGAPVLASARTRTSATAALPPDTVELARWEDTASSLTLVRSAYSPDFQLVLISKPASTQARSAIREAVRLDAVEAPRRELELRKKEVADASAVRDKTRTTNKAAFRP